ncbi:sushi, von Willebrand factor type A, EGF and pentraxin domain-containing protein 1-like [Pecten maximus]|uniref:sushi, von Willebrand factor type A, EGF and pentraxin domain-containing protein 1-like n=1 Tax=Pecten maximus TaxID=6579 RepID=UPI0014585D17|nr:sushi, von Willebrand factor type A, EGF and pentraxin domain-containing protein 1-like [Pecten maximus]
MSDDLLHSVSVCPDPPSVANASPSTTQKAVGTVITFTCDTGYIAGGTSHITCLTSGAWESLSFSCTDCGEPPTVSDATVQSGTNLVGSNRFYLCDGKSDVLSSNYVTCQDTGAWTTVNIACGDWPYGVYSLLQPTAGCPSGFLTGQRTWIMEQHGSSSSSNSFLAGYASGNNVQWHFCTKTDPDENTGPSSWPAGTYCILMHTEYCPSGFNDGNIYFDEEDSDNSPRSSSGTLPQITGVYDSRLYFCCRADSSPSTAMTMETSTPFVLFAHTGSTCQSVQGMTVSSGNTFFDGEDSDNIDTKFDSVAFANGPPDWRIYYCYYT